jgi:hypothetical protein
MRIYQKPLISLREKQNGCVLMRTDQVCFVWNPKTQKTSEINALHYPLLKTFPSCIRAGSILHH